MHMKTYEKMLEYTTYADRLKYLFLDGNVGIDTFGSKRWINQKFYQSYEWRNFRHKIIVRDSACDMALIDYPIFSQRRSKNSKEYSGIILHHINPCTIDDFLGDFSKIMDPSNIVCVSYKTHRLIHYGILEDIDLRVASSFSERQPNDTCPWKEVV